MTVLKGEAWHKAREDAKRRRAAIEEVRRNERRYNSSTEKEICLSDDELETILHWANVCFNESPGDDDDRDLLRKLFGPGVAFDEDGNGWLWAATRSTP